MQKIDRVADLIGGQRNSARAFVSHVNELLPEPATFRQIATQLEALAPERRSAVAVAEAIRKAEGYGPLHLDPTAAGTAKPTSTDSLPPKPKIDPAPSVTPPAPLRFPTRASPSAQVPTARFTSEWAETRDRMDNRFNAYPVPRRTGSTTPNHSVQSGTAKSADQGYWYSSFRQLASGGQSQEMETHVVGVAHEGRQAVVARMKVNEFVNLVRQPSNPYDSNAIAVLRLDGSSVGFLDRGLAQSLAARFDANRQPVVATVVAVTGGHYSNSKLGVQIRFAIPAAAGQPPASEPTSQHRLDDDQIEDFDEW